MRKYQLLSSFWLKIFALVFMTIDHIAVFFIPETTTTFLVFRILGRLSFPLFAFMIAEGMRYTHNKWFYLLRLFVMSVVLNLGYLLFMHNYEENIFTDLFLGALTIYLLQKKNWLSILSVFPITYSILTGFDFFVLDSLYGIYGLLLIVGFYFSSILAKYITNEKAKQLNIDIEIFQKMNLTHVQNLISTIVIISVNIFFWLFYINGIYSFIPMQRGFGPIQTYACLASVFLLLYNGKKGYDNKILQYGFYAYYPLHLVVLYIIFSIIY